MHLKSTCKMKPSEQAHAFSQRQQQKTSLLVAAKNGRINRSPPIRYVAPPHALHQLGLYVESNIQLRLVYISFKVFRECHKGQSPTQKNHPFNKIRTLIAYVYALRVLDNQQCSDKNVAPHAFIIQEQMGAKNLQDTYASHHSNVAAVATLHTLKRAQRNRSKKPHCCLLVAVLQAFVQKTGLASGHWD